MKITVDGTQALVSALNGYSKKVALAEKRAVRKTTDTAAVAINRLVAKQAGIPVYSAKIRILKYFSRSGNKSTIFAGANPLPVRYLAKNDFELLGQLINRPKIGVKVGKKRYAGSFVMPIGKNSKLAVFERLGKKRLPVQEVKMILQPFMAQAIEVVKPSISSDLVKKLNQELNYVMNVQK